MSEQPLALRLADALAYGFTARSRDASAELRRQHCEIEQLKAERDALLAQRQPLTDEELTDAYEELWGSLLVTAFIKGARYAEKAHGIGDNK